MPTLYPGALDTLTNPTAADTLAGVPHDEQHADANDAIEALETKLGAGASTPTTPGHFLKVTGVGATAYAAHGLTASDVGAEASGAVAAHEADTTAVHGIADTSLLATDTDVSTAVSNHAAAADPHAGYQKESEKGSANGYASLDASSLVPFAQLPTGTGASEVATGDHSHGGGSGGGVLAVTAYYPGTAGTITTTSNTLTDVDAANLSVTFTAPSSGKVIVRLSSLCKMSNTSSLHWGVRENTTDVAEAYVVDGTSTIGERRSVDLYITGLTASQSYTYKWAWRVGTSATGTIYRGGTVGGSNYGAAIMQVVEAP